MRDTSTKVRENRLRRVADRRGLKLRRSPRRDTHALDYDLYALTTLDGAGGTVHPEGAISPYALTLDEVEERLAYNGKCSRCSTDLNSNGYCGVCNPRSI